MSDFKLTCYRLFLEHPLVKYRTAVSDSRFELRVLLAGYGSRMDTLFQEVLVNGQLLDTDLYITFLTTNALKAANALLSRAPELKKYARITVEDTELNVPETTEIYASIQYRSLSKDEAEFARLISEAKTSGCNYTVISTGKDAQNEALARQAASVFGSGDLVSYIQNRRPQEIIESRACLFTFGYQKDTAYLDQLETIAYNLHYSYMKAANYRVSNRVIRDTFNEPYNYVSNLGAAIHIREKLECCGIDTSDNRTAAEQFAELMKDDPAVVDRLAALEHRRWMVEKILKGFIQVPSLDRIYSGPGVKTHDSNEKWHSCLVTCNATSRLTLDDWKKGTSGKNQNLDELDRTSLAIHERCGQIVHKNRDFIDNLLSTISDSVSRLYKGDREIADAMRSMELAISQMWQGKLSAVPIYEGHYQSLLDRVSSDQDSTAFYVRQSLSTLNDGLAPLKEFISFKDYKDQDRLLIRQIPFALTHKKQPVLMKLMAEKETDCLFSTCQLEPERTVFVGLVESHKDYLMLKEHVSNISRFLQQTYPAVAYEYHVILPERLAADHTEKILDLERETVRLHTAEKISHKTVSASLKEIAESVDADYIDVTNGSAMLVICAADAGTPVIAYESGSMGNIMNAPEIAYPFPEKVITVEEMFGLSGSVLKGKSGSAVLSDLSRVYKQLYRISKRSSMWPIFCEYVSDVYKDMSIRIDIPSPGTDRTVSEKTISLSTEIADALRPLFNQLEKTKYIGSLREDSSLTGQISFSFVIAAAESDNTFVDRLHECVRHYTPTASYRARFSREGIFILIEDLRIRNMTLTRKLKWKDRNTQETQAEELETWAKDIFKKILDDLAEAKLLNDYVVTGTDLNDMKFSFEFASRDILKAIQKSGNALEYYIYYSALLDAHFDDVEMGWHFMHNSGEDAPDNELDIICTRGLSSLFISAKSGHKAELKNNPDFLKYVIYEIALLADRFGINAKAVLAIPEADQFSLNSETNEVEYSKDVKNAYRRGVYLLGDMCFEDNVLGEVLDRIAAGRDDWCDFLKNKYKKSKHKSAASAVNNAAQT